MRPVAEYGMGTETETRPAVERIPLTWIFTHDGIVLRDIPIVTAHAAEYKQDAAIPATLCGMLLPETQYRYAPSHNADMVARCRICNEKRGRRNPQFLGKPVAKTSKSMAQYSKTEERKRTDASDTIVRTFRYSATHGPCPHCKKVLPIAHQKLCTRIPVMTQSQREWLRRRALCRRIVETRQWGTGR